MSQLRVNKSKWPTRAPENRVRDSPKTQHSIPRRPWSSTLPELQEILPVTVSQALRNMVPLNAEFGNALLPRFLRSGRPDANRGQACDAGDNPGSREAQADKATTEMTETLPPLQEDTPMLPEESLTVPRAETTAEGLSYPAMEVESILASASTCLFRQIPIAKTIYPVKEIYRVL